MQSHHNQEQMDVRTENEILVRGHVRKRKPSAPGATTPSRGKPYPTKWGRGKSYGFPDARIVVNTKPLPFLSRLRIAVCVLIGGAFRWEGQLAIIAAMGTKPVVKAMSTMYQVNRPAPHDDMIVGPLQ